MIPSRGIRMCHFQLRGEKSSVLGQPDVSGVGSSQAIVSRFQTRPGLWAGFSSRAFQLHSIVVSAMMQCHHLEVPKLI